MTQNQLNYLGLVEQKRNNIVVSKENERSHRANEAETNRHNVITEGETGRHNLIVEAQGDRNLTELERSNRAKEALQHDSNVNSRMNAETAAQATVASATIGAQASRANAQTAAQASQANAKVAADATKKAAATSAKAHTQSAAIAARASKYVANVNEAINKSKLKQSEKESLRRAANSLEVALANNDISKLTAGAEDLYTKFTDSKLGKDITQASFDLVDWVKDLADKGNAVAKKLTDKAKGKKTPSGGGGRY